MFRVHSIAFVPITQLLTPGLSGTRSLPIAGVPATTRSASYVARLTILARDSVEVFLTMKNT